MFLEGSWVNDEVGKCLSGKMSEWVNVGWVNVGWVNDGVGKCPGIQRECKWFLLSSGDPQVQ